MVMCAFVSNEASENLKQKTASKLVFVSVSMHLTLCFIEQGNWEFFISLYCYYKKEKQKMKEPHVKTEFKLKSYKPGH